MIHGIISQLLGIQQALNFDYGFMLYIENKLFVTSFVSFDVDSHWKISLECYQCWWIEMKMDVVSLLLLFCIMLYKEIIHAIMYSLVLADTKFYY